MSIVQFSLPRACTTLTYCYQCLDVLKKSQLNCYSQYHFKVCVQFPKLLIRKLWEDWIIFRGRDVMRLCSPVLLAVITAINLPSLARRGFKCSAGNSKSICLPDSYSKFELPNTETTNKIGISIDIDEVLRINDGTYSITFSTYFNVEWNERRLNLSPEFGASLRWSNCSS